MVVWFGSYGQVGRYVQIITCVFTIMGLYGFRILLWRFLGGVRRRVIILCDKGDWTSLLELVREKNSYYKVVGLSGDISRNAVHLNDPALLDSQKSILQHCRELSVHEVLFSREDNLSGAHREELVNLLYNGVTVRDYLHFMEHDFGRVPIEYIGVNWFFRLNTTGDYYLVMALKRQVDILLASIGLILSLPLLFIAAILIKMESLGPVFYPQIRVGEFGRPFRIWKLRSMRTDAEADGPHWAAQNDKRVTRVGRILRKTRIDELPQFWNILRGDMSWIGPRPERPEFIAQLEAAIPFYGQRHRIKPGLTGWAQINYPYGSSLEDSAHKLSYDLYYLNNLSTLLDIHIFLRTIGMIMRGAR
jgi:exopolysaccharide biosynthesis polyprenyl glycosylphosphotransferase